MTSNGKDLSSGVARLRDPYLIFCAGAIVVWLFAWVLAAPNLYGWLIDDEDTFARFQTYTMGGRHLVDIPWFHAYLWFLMLLPWQLHLTVASHVAPRAWTDTGQFRGLILYTIALHAIVLAMLASFLKRLCSNSKVAAAAFLLIVTSPTLALYTPLLDSRYLGFLAALPAMEILLAAAARGSYDSRKNTLTTYALPGLLFAVAEDIHYECLYLIVPFAIVYWVLALARDWHTTTAYRGLFAFVGGLLCWIVPVQLLSLLFQPFASSYIGTLLAHYTRQIPPYSRLEDLVTWSALFYTEMGVPMMLAVAAGAFILMRKRFRPAYVSAFNARLMVGCMGFFTAYVVASPTYPFYRMSFGFQFFYALCAVIFIERATSRLLVRHAGARRFAAGLALFAVAYVPSIVRAPEVYAAQQGYGKAVNVAYALAAPGHVRFIDVFDMDAQPQAVLSRDQFDRMSAGDYLVTYFPETFHFKYPDLFALLYNTQPVASYRTLWCTKEMWSQVPTFFGGRRWSDEPPNCEAQVFRVADIRAAARGSRLDIASVGADSSQAPTLAAARVFAIRKPTLYWYGSELWNRYWDLWVSNALPGEHYLDVTFAEPATIRKITIVPAEFRIPPDFLWHGRKRVENMRIYGDTVEEMMRPLWAGTDLQDRAIFTASFAPQRVTRLRFVMWQSPGPNQAVGIKYIYFPGYEQRTSWSNVDPPGRPPPGR